MLPRLRVLSLLILAWLAPLPAQQPDAGKVPAPHAICATTPDLAALCRAIGGDRVAVTSFAKGPEDPHFLEARPSWVRAVHSAEVLVEVGRDLEVGWLPLLVENGRNGGVLPGKPGRIVAADAVRALGVPTGPVDRSHGDVHAGGNPHFLLDPLCGLQVGKLLQERFAALWPAEAATFTAGFTTLRRELAVAMVGAEVAASYDYDAERLAQLFPSGKLDEVLQAHGDLPRLGGWFAALRPHRGARVVADHDLWPYFTERWGLRMVGFLEPVPGVQPSTAHLTALVATMQKEQVNAILSVPYFAPQHAAVVARGSGAKVAAMAHQPGARDGAVDYTGWVDGNVRALVAAIEAGRVAKD